MKRISPLVQLSAFLIVFLLALFVSMQVRDNETVRVVVEQYGYVGIFVIAAISGFNLVIPVPAIAFLPIFAEADMNIPMTIVIIAVGMSVADMVGYGIGSAGRDSYRSLRGLRIVRWLEGVRDRHPQRIFALLFLYAALVPFPNEVIVIPLAASGYAFWRIVTPLILGNLVFNSALALFVLSLYDAVL